MRFTEKKAKEILYFLARRIGAKTIQIHHADYYVHHADYYSNKQYVCCVYWDNGWNSRLWNSQLSNPDRVITFSAFRCNMWTNALKKLLDESNDGFDVCVCDKNTHGFVTVIPANCSIEKLLVEYDLDNE